MVRAFELAGAHATRIHIDRITADHSALDGFDLIGFPGGFSYGDDIASGRIFAMRLRERAWPSLKRAIDRGAAIIGACNGFQVLVQVGLLPGPEAGHWPQAAPPPQRVALTDNITARFTDRWVGMDPLDSCNSVWVAGLVRMRAELVERFGEQVARDVMMLPVAHGEGRLVTADAATLADIERRGCVGLRYTDNFNGSESAIAGLSSGGEGRIFGLMPHPERFLDWTRHPYWTRLPEAVREGPTPGLVMFQGAVAAVQTAVLSR